MRYLTLSLAFLIILAGSAHAGNGVRVTNEMIYQKLLEIEKRQAVLEAQFKEFKEQVNKRFEQVDKRFAELRQDMNARFEQLYTFLWIITGIFTTMVVAVIGFAYWDRRTIIRKARDEAIETIEKEGRLRDLIRALRKLAEEDKKLAEVLRSFGLL